MKAEQGSAERGAGTLLAGMRPHSRSWARRFDADPAHLRGQIPKGPSSARRRARLRGCDPECDLRADTMLVGSYKRFGGEAA